MIDLDDPQAENIADVLSNKTAKKILGLLAHKEMSSSEISSKLKMRLNTVGYNLKKLVASGLVEKVKKFFWSSKGRRMEIYKVSNKRIVIMPRKIIRGILPAVFVAGVAAIGIKLWTRVRIAKGAMSQSITVVRDKIVDSTAEVGDTAERMAESTTTTTSAGSSAGAIAEPASQVTDTILIESVNQTAMTLAQSAWLWFFVGALTAMLVYLVWNWGKR